MNYKNKIYKITLSKLKKLSYPQGNTWYSPVSMPSNPDNFAASQQSKFYNLIDRDVPFCSKCNSKNIAKHKNEYICLNCNSRFSNTHFMVGETPGSRETGLLDLDHAGEQASKYHTDHQIGAGSASVSWGKGDRT